MILNLLDRIITAVFLLCCVISSLSAHEHAPQNVEAATYLGNEGVLITTKHGKVLFDPFFHNDYGIYTLVPEAMRGAIFTGDKPYDDISAIVISHAHEDHFSAEDSLRYLLKHSATILIGPDQAVDKIRTLSGADSVESQLIGISLQVGDLPMHSKIGSITIETVRIPHAGWPRRKDVSNLVHRVTFGENLNVIQMGDADPNDLHFKPYQKLWEETESELAFPPYWFFSSREGSMILRERINTQESIGIHVPTNVPDDLKRTGADYFSMPGELRKFVQSGD